MSFFTYQFFPVHKIFFKYLNENSKFMKIKSKNHEFLN